MKRSTKILITVVALIKVSMIGFISFTSEMLVISQLVLIPLLLLESLAIAGFTWEFAAESPCRPQVRVSNLHKDRPNHTASGSQAHRRSHHAHKKIA